MMLIFDFGNIYKLWLAAIGVLDRVGKLFFDGCYIYIIQYISTICIAYMYMYSTFFKELQL